MGLLASGYSLTSPTPNSPKKSNSGSSSSTSTFSLNRVYSKNLLLIFRHILQILNVMRDISLKKPLPQFKEIERNCAFVVFVVFGDDLRLVFLEQNEKKIVANSKEVYPFAHFTNEVVFLKLYERLQATRANSQVKMSFMSRCS